MTPGMEEDPAGLSHWRRQGGQRLKLVVPDGWLSPPGRGQVRGLLPNAVYLTGKGLLVQLSRGFHTRRSIPGGSTVVSRSRTV